MDHVTHDPRLHEDDEDVDLLGWWRDNEHQFPVLSQFARDVLLVPVSTKEILTRNFVVFGGP
jgi:hypothetical protein